MSTIVHRFEFAATDTPHVHGAISRYASKSDYVDRAAFIGVLAESKSYDATPRIDWDQAKTAIAFQTLDQLDAVIDGLEQFRRAWVEENMCHTSGQLSIAAD